MRLWLAGMPPTFVCMHACPKIASAVFTQPPLGTVGLSEEEAQAQLAGPIDVYVSKFKPMKNTITGGTEKTLMKVIVKADTDEVLSVSGRGLGACSGGVLAEQQA